MTKSATLRWLLVAFIAIGASVFIAQKSDAKTVSTLLSPGRSVSLVVRQPLRRTGEWVLRMRVSSDGEKKFRIRASRGAGPSFTVVSTGTKNGLASCDAGAGSIFCENVTVPAVPAPGTWTFTAKNTGTHRFRVAMTVTWRPVASAG